jgi:hypothetical protein
MIQTLSATCFALFLGCSASAAPFFGQHVFYAPTFNQLAANPFDGIRIWGTPATIWRGIEPSAGTYDFSALDGIVTPAVAQNRDILLTLGQTPAWASSRPAELGSMGLGAAAEPSDMGSWSSYVQTVASRYRGKIASYEVMNEPRIPEAIAMVSPGFFSGSTAKLITMTQLARAAINTAAPGSTLVCPSMDGDNAGVARLKYFLSQGGGQNCDAIGFHFYLNTWSVSDFQSLLAQVKQVMAQYGQGNKPLWDTEIGVLVAQSGNNVVAPQSSGPLSVVFQDAAAARVMSKIMLASIAGGVSRTYWFAYDSSSMGSTGPNKNQQQLNQLGVAYQTMHNWLAGATLGACSVSDVQGSCNVVRDNVVTGMIVWGTSYTQSSLQQLNIRTISLLNGSQYAVSSLTASQTPATLSNQFQDPMLISY